MGRGIAREYYISSSCGELVNYILIILSLDTMGL